MTRVEHVAGVYREAVNGARDLWAQAKDGAGPDPDHARRIVRSLARAFDDDAAAIVALTESPSDANVVVTHMVNVAVLTVAQTTALGLGGPLLEAFGMAALLHDIGKVCTPPEILSKPGPLTSREFSIVKRHVIDGASILRRTRGMPSIAAVVALEHHLKQDGSGYPEGISRRLNVATSIVSIADVFDALRGDRPYRPGITANRIHALMSDERRGEFHGPLLTQFAALMRRLKEEHTAAASPVMVDRVR